MFTNIVLCDFFVILYPRSPTHASTHARAHLCRENPTNK